MSYHQYKIKKILIAQFEIKDLGQIKHYIGMEVTRDTDGNYELCQSSYIAKIATEFGLQDARPVKTPMELNYGKTGSLGLTNTGLWKEGGTYTELPLGPNIRLIIYIYIYMPTDRTNTRFCFRRKFRIIIFIRGKDSPPSLPPNDDI